jgi:hypothetical protein
MTVRDQLFGMNPGGWHGHSGEVFLVGAAPFTVLVKGAGFPPIVGEYSVHGIKLRPATNHALVERKVPIGQSVA